jgi:hypothetical protein
MPDKFLTFQYDIGQSDRGSVRYRSSRISDWVPSYEIHVVERCINCYERCTYSEMTIYNALIVARLCQFRLKITRSISLCLRMLKRK